MKHRRLPLLTLLLCLLLTAGQFAAAGHSHDKVPESQCASCLHLQGQICNEQPVLRDIPISAARIDFNYLAPLLAQRNADNCAPRAPPQTPLH